jgi:hypothetical protein
MVAHADPQPRAHPIKENRDAESAPVEHKKRSHGSHMEKRHGDGSSPVDSMIAVDVDNGLGHGISKM